MQTIHISGSLVGTCRYADRMSSVEKTIRGTGTFIPRDCKTTASHT
jgi:hypothetical protein